MSARTQTVHCKYTSLSYSMLQKAHRWHGWAGYEDQYAKQLALRARKSRVSLHIFCPQTLFQHDLSCWDVLSQLRWIPPRKWRKSALAAKLRIVMVSSVRVYIKNIWSRLFVSIPLAPLGDYMTIPIANHPNPTTNHPVRFDAACHSMWCVNGRECGGKRATSINPVTTKSHHISKGLDLRTTGSCTPPAHWPLQRLLCIWAWNGSWKKVICFGFTNCRY